MGCCQLVLPDPRGVGRGRQGRVHLGPLCPHPYAHTPRQDQKRRHRRRRQRPLPSLQRGCGTDERPWVPRPTASRSRGRASSPRAPASRMPRGSTFTTGWSMSCSPRASRRLPRSTTGTCRRHCRTGTADGSHARRPRRSGSTPGTWPSSSAIRCVTFSPSTSFATSPMPATAATRSTSAAGGASRGRAGFAVDRRRGESGPPPCRAQARAGRPGDPGARAGGHASWPRGLLQHSRPADRLARAHQGG
jgi:hypothetical protein